MANFQVPPYPPPAAMFNTVPGYPGTMSAGGAMAAPPAASIHTPLYAPPAANMFNTVPGYPGTMSGGGAMAAPPAASIHTPLYAPPAANIIPGYEGIVAGGGGACIPPPPPSVPMPVPEQAPCQQDWHIPSISEDRAREAFAEYVSSKCCYSSDPVTDGVITNMESFNTYRYRLETFLESRSAEWSQEPYTGQPVDAGVQPAPGPWQIAAQPPAFFQEHKQTIKVPFTSSVKNCDLCQTKGKTPCTTCNKTGKRNCTSCNGSGNRESGEQCVNCHGTGRKNCLKCSGSGSCKCDTCDGKGKLLIFINLNVKWSIDKDEFLAQDSSGLKVEKLQEVSGKELIKDAQHMVYPVRGFPDVSVAQASERLVKDHQGKNAKTSRILQQRQTIELIPITKVNYKWKGNPYVYYVFGNEFKVKAVDYPATCCCSVM
ncbi:protein SSUH2 homolog [Carassius gibelio]|uniref:protein SSUH2 homolog n=1 Tax=Carassius gibelio TaxID=101364 RepID=UPI002279184A|nr:protein SSUH2 homolog [Carassius gibelio]